MAIERTLVIIKPDAVRRNNTMAIIELYEKAGLSVVERKWYTRLTEQQAERFYSEHRGKFFFDGLVLAMVSGPVEVLVLEGEDAIEKVREMNGATDPSKAEPGTIRYTFRSAGGPFNTVHGSDSRDAFHRERSILFDTLC